MEPEAQKADDEQPLWVRSAHYALAGLVFGSALLLAYGGAPTWLETAAAGFLWCLLSLFYIALAVALAMLVMPVPAELPAARRDRKEEGQRADPEPPRPWRRIRWIARRLCQIAFVAALLVAGRPAMAGLFFVLPFAFKAFDVGFKKRSQGAERSEFGNGEWAVYLTFRFVVCLPYHAFRLLILLLKWLVWVPMVSAVLACLLQADMIVKRRSLKALDLPRPLIHLLYRRSQRRVWKDFMLWCLWLAVALLSLALNFAGASEGAQVLTTVLMAVAAPVVALTTLAFVVPLIDEDAFVVGFSSAPKTFAGRLGLHARHLLALLAIGMLLLAGEPLLAGLYLWIFLVVVSIAVLPDFMYIDEEEPYVNPIKGLICVFVMCVILVPLTPIWLPIAVYESWIDFRLGRDLRSLFAMPNAFAYFVYARPDQQECFLGTDGVLAPFRDRVVARDWRDLLARRRGPSRSREFAKSVEGRLVRRFDIRRSREHLPFLAIVVGRRIEAFHLGRAYRDRLRDGGAALGKLEKEIKELVARSFVFSPG